MAYPADPSKNYPMSGYSNTPAAAGIYNQPYAPPQGNLYNPSAYGGNVPPPAYAPSSGYPAAPPPHQSGPRVRPTPSQAETGGVGEDTNQWAGASFSDKVIRHRFIRKVYLILTVQLLVTVGVVCLFTFHEGTKNWVQSNSWFYFLAYVLFLALFITLACCRGVRRKYPANFICLGIFTLAFSYVAGVIASYHDTESVLIVLGITTVVVVAVSLFACQTKIDFTMCMGVLFGLFIVLFCFGILVILIQFVLTNSQLKILTCVYGGLGALVFTIALIVDTQLIMGGKRYELEEEEYIYGALNLYVDIVYLFLFILMLFGGASN